MLISLDDTTVLKGKIMRPLVKFTNFDKLRLLNEAYHKTGKEECYEIITALISKLRRAITDEQYQLFCDMLNIHTSVLEGYDYSAISASYGRVSETFEIQYTKHFEDDLKRSTKDDIGLFVDNLWTAFIHEDKHKQQNSKIPKDIKLKLNNSYVTYLPSDPTNLSYPQNLEYYNQVTEADAYGREVGGRLVSQYGNNVSTSRMLGLLKTNKDDSYVRTIYNIYKDPRISQEATEHFFRSLFDFLEGNEGAKNG